MTEVEEKKLTQLRNRVDVTLRQVKGIIKHYHDLEWASLVMLDELRHIIHEIYKIEHPYENEEEAYDEKWSLECKEKKLEN